MTDKYTRYRAPNPPVPEETWSWNMYGPGVENIGREGQAEREPVPQPNDEQLLVRVDAVGMCFSDVKLIRQGGAHPKLYNRDLAKNPTRLGHEATVTILKVGEKLAGTYSPGQRLAIQPDIYQNGMSTAYGYTIPGGLTQYHLIGPEVLDADDGAYVLPLDENMGYAETALTEPWACVEAAYTQRRRLEPKAGGTMWIVGQPGDTQEYEFSSGLDAPATIVLTDVPASVRALVDEQSSAQLIERNGLSTEEYDSLREESGLEKGFDDIVMLAPHSAQAVSQAARLIARRGTFNLVGEAPLDEKADVDVGRIHYDYTAYIGNQGPDIAASYGEARNRADLRPNGVAVFVGAGGPMGQMHVQRAIELRAGPRTIIATDINTMRLEALQRLFGPLAESHDRQLLTLNPQEEGPGALRDLVMRESDGRGADDVVVSVPVAALMSGGAELLAPDGMLVLFAGVPNGTFAPLDLSQVYLSNAQYTGTSGSALSDQALVIEKTRSGDLSPNQSVAAVGGIEAARDGIEAMMDGRYAGKVVIFPQVSGLPLMGLDELMEQHPEVAEKLGPGNVWTAEAEAALVEKFWQPADDAGQAES